MNYELNITQPLLHQFLNMIGISISTGKLNDILTEKHDIFHQEKEDILKTGLACSDPIRPSATFPFKGKDQTTGFFPLEGGNVTK